MALPVQTTLDDIRRICQYLATKPTGVTTTEAQRVLGANYTRQYKTSALRVWGLIEDVDGRLKITNAGRQIIKDQKNGMPKVLKDVIRRIEPYIAVIERAAHTGEDSITTLDVASYWHDNFQDDVGSSERNLNDQAVCFFQIISGAELGEFIVGRKGSPTRVDFNRDAIESFVGAGETIDESGTQVEAKEEPQKVNQKPTDNLSSNTPSTGQKLQEHQELAQKVNRVFITHGKNAKIVEQLKEIVTFGKFTPIIAEEHETPSKPVPQKVMDDMRSCNAGIIHVASEQVLIDEDGKPHHKINENVLIEIGAAMALYKNNFILLVQKGIQLPSNLQGLYECRYEGDKLDGEATMKLLKAFNEFR